MNLLKTIFTVLVLFYSYETKAQSDILKSYRLFINLDKAPFDSLYLQDYTEGRNVLIQGEKTKAFTWKITIPSKLIQDSENMVLLASPYDSKSNSKQMIRFVTERDEKRIVIVNVGVEEENNYIYGTYIDTAIFHNESLLTKINNKDTVITGDLICADFNLIIKDANADIAVRSHDPFFSWFMGEEGKNNSYDNQLQFYIELSKEFPNSRFLMSNLADNITKYKSKDDIRNVYDNFSGRHKNTIWAKHIERYLDEKKFQNTFLPTVEKIINEKIIQDTSKFNLIIFTASWCIPCIKEIPLLRSIYKDLGINLVFTYISIDDETGVASFKKMIKNKNIPWRSLFAYQNIKEIKQKYFIEGIPHCILVYPNQTMETIDVRKYDDRLKLYSVLKSPKK